MRRSLLKPLCVLLTAAGLTPTSSQADAEFIPLLDGFYEYLEEVNTYSRVGDDETSAWFYGTDALIAEIVSASAGSASGYARTAPGAGGLGPRAETKSSSRSGFDSYHQVGADASLQYDLQLVKLHPDAPDDISIPLLYTSFMSGGVTGRLWIKNLSTDQELVYETNPGFDYEPYVINSQIDVPLGDTIRAAVFSGQSVNPNDVPPAIVTGPVFEIDPDFLVRFIDNADGTERYESAAALYSLAYPAAIGYAGSFATVTPLTDGCLPDPSILGPSGTQSVTGNAAVTCRAIDPSGFRSYGPGVEDPMGDLDDMAITITPGAIVTTDGNDTETIGILGNNNDIYNVEGEIRAGGQGSVAVYLGGGDGNTVTNYGAITSSGLGSNAIEIEGDDARIYNTGNIGTTNAYSAAIFVEGDGTGVLNEGVVAANGFRSSAVVLEGDGIELSNEGIVQTTSDQAAGLVFEGLLGQIDNDGSIGTQGVFSPGIIALGISSINNSGQIATNGVDAMGILALGPGHQIVNDGSGTSNQIYTTGARAHGIALGVQEIVLPEDVEIPVEALDPASGTIASSGPITTEGTEADAIHALAHNLEVIHTGELTTQGVEAHGISIEGRSAVVRHGDASDSGSIATSGRGASGIEVWGNDATVVIDGGTTSATILTEGRDADGVFVTGARARIDSAGEITVEGSGGSGIDVFGTGARVENTGAIVSGSGSASSDNRGLKVMSSHSETRNFGTIRVLSEDGYGILAVDDGIKVLNGDTSHRAASIEVVGANGIGIHAESDAPVVANEGSITVSGSEAIGINAIAGVGSVSDVTSAGTITVEGIGATGMRLATDSVWDVATAVSSGPACAEIDDGTSKLINCGSVDFADSPFGVGMLAEGVAHTTIENQGRIEGGAAGASGVGARGIRVVSGQPDEVGERNNLIANVDRVIVTGENAVGIEVSGDNNLILHGNGTIALPEAAFAPVTALTDETGFTLYPTADQFSNEFTRDVPAGTLLPVARILVSGKNAVGLSITGDGNRAGQVFSAQDDATLIAVGGEGAIGVKLSGTANLFVNAGEIEADGVGIQGDAGADSVTNQGFVIGGIDLAGGSDRLVLDWSSEIQGLVDGGEGDDELIFFVGGDLTTGAFEKVVDGDQFQNFEEGAKIGAGTLRVLDRLEVDTFTAYAGTTHVTGPGRFVTGSNSFHVKEGATLAGTGTVEGRVSIEGGRLAPGDPFGTLTVQGDLDLGGLLEIEIGGRESWQYDVLRVFGDTSLFDTTSLHFIFGNGFAPMMGDTFDFLITDNLLGELDLIDVGISGLLPGFDYRFDLHQGGLAMVALSDGRTSVPLPPAIVLMAAGLLLVTFSRRSIVARS